jgi:hypothetical protein
VQSKITLARAGEPNCPTRLDKAKLAQASKSTKHALLSTTSEAALKIESLIWSDAPVMSLATLLERPGAQHVFTFKMNGNGESPQFKKKKKMVRTKMTNKIEYQTLKKHSSSE